MGSDITPFSIEVSEDAMIELRQKLVWTRWPDDETVDDWSQGAPNRFVQSLAEYWRDAYDWPTRAERLNRFDQFMTPIDTGPLSNGEANSSPGETLDIHFIHQRSPHEDATPLIITHGWPGSIVEFEQVIEPLTNPTEHGGTASDAFHVVAPSLPGFAFSGKPTQPGVGVEVIAHMWATLMERLGYERYLAQGGDWGSLVTHHLVAHDPQHCTAAHMTMAMKAVPTGDAVNDAQRHALERLGYYRRWDNGYSQQMRTRPQTVAYGLADSPAGQLAWIMEKFWYWTDHRDVPDDVFSIIERDLLLDNVMMYWLNNAAASSARIYWESMSSKPPDVVTNPAGFTVYPGEIVPPVREWLAPLFDNVVYWNEEQHGGHFAAFEQPTAFVDDLRNFRREVWS